MKQKLIGFLLKLLWKYSDDIDYTINYMYHLYDNVPEELKNDVVHVYTIYDYSKSKHREKCLEWLYKDEEE